MNAKYVFSRKVIAGPLAIVGYFPFVLQAEPIISPETGAPATVVMEAQSNAAEPTGFAATGITPGVVDVTPIAESEPIAPVLETVPTDARGVVSDQAGGIVSGQWPEDDRPELTTFANTGVRQ